MTPAEILRGAAALLAKPGTWQQHGWAFNSDGKWCMPSDPDAVCWCLRGAIYRVAGVPLNSESSVIAAAENALRAAIRCDGLAQWNDMSKRTAEEVCAALIKAAETQERMVPRWGSQS